MNNIFLALASHLSDWKTEAKYMRFYHVVESVHHFLMFLRSLRACLQLCDPLDFIDELCNKLREAEASSLFLGRRLSRRWFNRHCGRGRSRNAQSIPLRLDKGFHL